MINKFKELLAIKFVGDVAWNIMAALIIAGSGILLNVIIAAYYQVDGLGTFNEALSWFLILSTISSFGLSESLVNSIAAVPDDKTEVGNIILSAIILSFAVIGILLVCLGSLYLINASLLPERTTLVCLFILILSLPLLTINKNLQAVLNGYREMKWYAIIQSLRYLLIMLIILLMGWQNFQLSSTLFAFIFTELILFFVLLMKAKKYFHLTFTNIGPQLKKHFHFGKNNVLTSSIGEVNNNIGIIIAGKLLTKADTGIFSISISIAKGIFLIPSVFQLNFNPVISFLYAKKDIVTLQNNIRRIRKVSILLMSALAIVVSFAFPVFIYLFFKDNIYTDSYYIFLILLVGITFCSFFYFSAAILTMSGYTQVQLTFISIILITNTATSILACYVWGIYGIAISTSLSYFIIPFVLNYFMKKKLSISIFN